MHKIVLALWKSLENSTVSFKELQVLSKLFNKETLTSEELASVIDAGLVTPDKYWTDKGIQEFYQLQGSFNENLQESHSKDFEEWWNTFPLSDGHAHWPVTRTLRLNKDRCLASYQRILSKGKITAEQLLKAIENEVKNRKVNSAARNEMKFMVSSVRYLDEGFYEAWLDKNIETTDSSQFSGYNQTIF